MSWIDLDGAVNVRDVGGLPTVDGRTTRAGVLLRSDNLQDLSEADVQRLVGELGVRTVLDLRSSGEVHLTGPGPLREAGPAHHQLSLIPEWDGEPDREEVDRALDSAVQDALPSLAPGPRQQGPTDLGDHYADYIAKAGDNLGRALRLLADPASGTTLVHCAAGKDRTGVVVALALDAAGVEREAVVADYAATAERIEGIIARLSASSTYASEVQTHKVEEFKPRAETMARFLALVDERHGGAAEWLRANGLSESELAALRGRLRGG